LAVLESASGRLREENARLLTLLATVQRAQGRKAEAARSEREARAFVGANPR